MPDQPDQKASGADLARQALAAYKTSAKTRPTKTPRPRGRRADRGSGRDPVGFGAVLERLNAEQNWRVGLEGGSILDQWTTLCPQFVGRVEAVAFDRERGRLDLRPASAAYATQLRLLSAQLGKQINDKLGRITVQAIRVLPIGPIATSVKTPEIPEEPAPVLGPVRTRETASPGYRRVLALHLAHKPEAPAENPLVAAARARQEAALADPARREPETAFTDGVAEAERVAAPDQAAAAEAVRQAAIRLARARKAGTDVQPVRRLFETA